MKIIWKYLTNTSNGVVAQRDKSQHRLYTTKYEDLCM